MTKTQNSKVVLDIQHVAKSFGPKVVHKDVNLQLYEHEMLGLFGGSGSGKSVILRSIIGIEKPDQGKILFDHQDIAQLDESELIEVRKRIGYVFQNGALFDSLTVEDNLSYPLREHTKLSDAQILDKVNQMLALVDLKGQNQLLPAELSGGMQKRAGLARAIIMEPKIILFDEPTAGLDPGNTHRLLQNILRLKQTGMTGIFVTHDIPAAFEICDRIAILHEGKIAVADTVDAIKKSNDPLVKSFIENALHGVG